MSKAYKVNKIIHEEDPILNLETDNFLSELLGFFRFDKGLNEHGIGLVEIHKADIHAALNTIKTDYEAYLKHNEHTKKELDSAIKKLNNLLGELGESNSILFYCK